MASSLSFCLSENVFNLSSSSFFFFLSLFLKDIFLLSIEF